MVVGDGMLATAFLKAGINTEHHIIFASGVSNSKETDTNEFKKEIDLLMGYSESGSKLVYFSTASIFDPSLTNSPYIIHKQNIEKIIRDNFLKHLIIRLPNVVGKSDNPNTLTNFLYLSLVNETRFNLYLHATRYLIDIDDVVKFTSVIIQKTKNNQSINLALNNKIPVYEIYRILTEITGKKGNYKEVAEGSDFEIDTSQAMEIIGKEQFLVTPEEYTLKVLKKYYKAK
jgi:nucleoside-diphosphate-sugar epimerase